MAEINVVPYIDVMLVLLIIFMITAPLLTEGIKVELPKAAAEPIDAGAVNNIEPLVLSVDARGRVVLVKGDHAVDYGRIVAAMVMLQQAGATKLGFLTEPPPPRTP